MLQPKHFLDNRVPPLVVAAAAGACMRGAVALSPQLSLAWAGRAAAAWVLAVLGAAIIVAGLRSFSRHRTTVNPLDPAAASNLVETGIFRRTRNPMYLGMTVALLGYGVFLAHPIALVLVLLFPAYIQRFQITPEERALDRLFGEAYAGYKKRVPRWL